MSETLKHQELAAGTMLAFWEANNSVPWETVGQRVLPKVRQALQHRFKAEPYAVSIQEGIQSGVRELLQLLADSPQRTPQTLPELESWLVVVSYRKLVRQLRKEHLSRRHGAPAESELVSQDATLLDTIFATSPPPVDALVQQLHERLNPFEREVLRLKLEGKTHPEIAEFLHVSNTEVASTSKRIFRRGKQLGEGTE